MKNDTQPSKRMNVAPSVSELKKRRNPRFAAAEAARRKFVAFFVLVLIGGVIWNLGKNGTNKDNTAQTVKQAEVASTIFDVKELKKELAVREEEDQLKKLLIEAYEKKQEQLQVAAPSLPRPNEDAAERRIIINSILGAIRQGWGDDDDMENVQTYVTTEMMEKNIVGVGMTLPKLKRWFPVCFGHEITVKEYVGNVGEQSALTRCAVEHYWDRYHDARIVASCWMTGQTNFREKSDLPPCGNHWCNTLAYYMEEDFLKELKKGDRPQLAIPISKGRPIKSEPCIW